MKSHSWYTGGLSAELRYWDMLNHVRRAAYLDAVLRHVDMRRVSFQKRCTSVTQSQGSKPTMYFADGTTATADVVIGADGIKSAVRGAVTGVDPSGAVTFSQCSCYRGLAPTEAVKAAGVKTDLTRRPILFTGEGKVSTTIRCNQCANIYICSGQHLIVFSINAGKLVRRFLFMLCIRILDS